MVSLAACSTQTSGMASLAVRSTGHRCSKQDCLLHANIRCGTRDGVLRGEAWPGKLAGVRRALVLASVGLGGWIEGEGVLAVLDADRAAEDHLDDVEAD